MTMVWTGHIYMNLEIMQLSPVDHRTLCDARASDIGLDKIKGQLKTLDHQLQSCRRK